MHTHKSFTEVVRHPCMELFEVSGEGRVLGERFNQVIRYGLFNILGGTMAILTMTVTHCKQV